MPEEAPAAPSDDRRWRWLGVLACVGVIASALPSLPPGVSNWDNGVKLQVALSLLEGRGPVLTGPTPDDAQYVVPGRDGRPYSGYPPFAFVLQFLTIGVAAAGGPVAEGMPTLALLGLVAWALVAWGRRSGASPAGAVAGAMLVCFGTTLWPMATHGYDILVEVLALCLVLWAGAGEERRFAWLVAGLVVGMAFACRLGAAILGLPALVLLLAQPPREARAAAKRGLSFALGCVPGIALVLWYNHLRFGSPFTVYQTSRAFGTLDQLVVPWFSRPHWEAMGGLLISPGKGLVWYGPPLLAVALLALPLARRHRAAFAALAAQALLGVLLLGRFVYWHGEWGWGPRYVAPLCLAAAPLGWYLWGRAEHRAAARATIVAAIAVLAALQAAPVVGSPVHSYMSSVVVPLAQAGRLVTSPLTRPPLPADNGTLYYRLDTAPILSLARTFPARLRHPTLGPPARAALLRAMLVPALAAVVILAASSRDRRRTSGPGIARVE